jgi:hypothetical protein
MAGERTQAPGQRSADEQSPSLATQSGERTYREEEIARILQRAAGLERKRQLDRPTLTLAEVEAIAGDSGIDPSLVRQAARDLENECQTGLGTRLAGVRVHRTFERVVEGEISSQHHEQLAADIRTAVMGTAAMPAQVSTIGRTMSWGAWTSGGVVEIQITPREGKTFIRIDVNAAQIAGGIFGGIIGGVGGGVGANVAWALPMLLHLPPLVGVLGLLSVVGSAYGLARWLFSSRVGAIHQRLERLADALEAHVRGQLARRP